MFLTFVVGAFLDNVTICLRGRQASPIANRFGVDPPILEEYLFDILPEAGEPLDRTLLDPELDHIARRRGSVGVGSDEE